MPPMTACALAVENYTVVVEQCRKLINTHQFNNEPMRLLLSSLSSGLRPADSFISSTLQKHMLREVRLSDGAVKTPELLKWHNASQRYHLGTAKSAGDDDAIKGADAPEDDAEEFGDATEPAPSSDKRPLWLPTKNNPIPVTLYGQLCLAAKSYQSAICKSASEPNPDPSSVLIVILQFIYCMGMTIVRKIRSYACAWDLRRWAGLCSVKRTIATTSSHR